GRDDEDVARADDHAREDVATEPIRSEPVVRARCLQAVEGIRGERVLEHERLAEDRAQHPEADDDRADDEGLRVQEVLQALFTRGSRIVARRADCGRDFLDGADRGRGCRAGAHESALPSRTRGLRTEYRMSAISVETRKTTPTTSTAASSDGKSFCVAA